jgi:DNA-binding CsgD family transcriptional regulator
MIKYLVTLVFVLSVAIASGSILISTKIRSHYKTDFLSTLMYLQAFYFTYGFYAIWGQIIVASFLSPFITREALTRTTNIMILLGSPFVVFTWLMLLKFTLELSGRLMRNSFIFLYLAVNLLLPAGIGLILTKFTALDSFTVIKYCFITLSFLYTLAGAAYLLFKGKRKALLRKADVKNISFGLVLFMLLQNVVLFYYEGNIMIALVFILVFFIGGAFIPVYIRYLSDLSILLSSSEIKTTFELLCRNYEISPREKEIIREICNGLSNQQIADKLFISLQTVKDHTSRIYYKTNCSSRAQLMTLVKDKT